MTLSFTPNLSPKLSAPATNTTAANTSRKNELNASGVNILIPEDAKEEASKARSSSSIANTAIKKNLASSKSSSPTSSNSTQVADASNSTGVPNSGTGGESRFGDLAKNGGQGLQSEIDRSRADTKDKIAGDTVKDTASETSAGGSSGGSGAFSLPGTGAGTAMGPGANSGPNFGTINNNFGNQNLGGNQSFGEQNSWQGIANPPEPVTPSTPEVAVESAPEPPPTAISLTGTESINGDIPG